MNSCESQTLTPCRRKSSVSSPVVLVMTKERRNIFSYIRVLKLYIIEQILGNIEPLLLLNKEAFRMS